jgi:choline dehydrogenase-like flavoprotein
MNPLELVARPDTMRHHDGSVDVCIVGCGASGSVLAKELAESGLSVVVLEAGPWLSTDDDLRQDELQMLGKFDWDDRRWVAGSEELEMGHRRDGRGVGGGTLHYGAVALRLWREDFERQTRDGVGADWPLSYDDIIPCYDAVEHELALSGPRSMPWGGPHPGSYPQGPHPLSARDLIVARGMEALGIAWSENALAILTGRHDGRSPCMNYGYCQWGCKSRAKASMHVTYVPKAVLAGAEIRDRSRAVELEVDDTNGRITGVVYARDGALHRQRAAVTVLAGFCIENPRLLFHSATSAHPDGLANSSGTLGRYLMAHVADSCFGRFDEPVHQWSTSPGTLLSQHHYGTRADRDYVGGWSWMTSCLFPAEFGITLAKAGEGWWGQRLTEALAAYPHWLVMGSEGECLPHPSNRVELSDDIDEFGVPRPRVSFDFGDNERAMRADIHRIADNILRAAGATEVVISEGNDHLMGGCRMGASAETSVVDADCRTWDHPNLFICDASVFPSSGGAQPSQTVMALALRLARHLTDSTRRLR